MQGDWGGAIENLGYNENYLGSSYEAINTLGENQNIGLPETMLWIDDDDTIEDKAAAKARNLANSRADYDAWRAE